jgi:hypothetical protein
MPLNGVLLDQEPRYMVLEAGPDIRAELSVFIGVHPWLMFYIPAP